MKEITKTIVKGLLWKEAKELIRRNLLIILNSLVLPLFIILYTAYQINLMDLPIEQKQALFGSNIAFIPLLVIPFFGSSYLVRIVAEEKIRRQFHILVSSAISLQVIAIVKFVITVLISYILNIIVCILYCLSLLLLFNANCIISSYTWFMLFIFIPLICYCLLAVINFLLFRFRNTQIISFVFPLLSVFGAWGIIIKHGTISPSYVLLILCSIISIFITLFIQYSIRFINIEKAIE